MRVKTEVIRSQFRTVAIEDWMAAANPGLSEYTDKKASSSCVVLVYLRVSDCSVTVRLPVCCIDHWNLGHPFSKCSGEAELLWWGNRKKWNGERGEYDVTI